MYQPDMALLAQNLKKAAMRGDKLASCCPFHDDSNASFVVFANGGYQCAGCAAKGHWPTLYVQLGLELPSRDARVARDARVTYDYVNENGVCIAKVERIETDTGKTFRQHSLKDGRWEAKKHYPFPFFHLDRIAAASAGSVVWIVEGEKCVEAIASLGQLATTASGGANGLEKADQSGFQHLRGKRCIILPDNDDAGEACAASWHRECRKRGIEACIVRIAGAAKKADIYDYLSAGGKLDDLVRQADQKGALSREAQKLATSLRAMLERLEAGEEGLEGTKRDALLAIAGSASYSESVESNTTLEKALYELAEEIRTGATAARVFTGITGVDRLVGGFRKGRLCVVGGAPGTGKTAFLWQLVETFAEGYGPSYVLSQEMTAIELAERTAVRHLRKPLDQIHFQEVIAIGARVAAMKRIEICARSATLEWFEADLRLWHAMRCAEGSPPSCAMVDYLQLFDRGDARSKEDERAYIARVTRKMKQLAKDLGLNVFLVSTCNRSGREGSEPTMACFMGSSSIEYDADVAMVLWDDCKLHVLKNRAGCIGSVAIGFDKPFMTFYESTPLSVDCPAGWIDV